MHIETDDLTRRAQRSDMLTALLRHSAHELRNVAQVLGITTDAIHNNPSVDAVYRDAIAQSNDSLLHLLERLERSLIPAGTRPAPFAAADPVKTVAVLVTRRGPSAHLEVEVDVSRALKPCDGIEAELAEALFALLRSMAELTVTHRRTKVRITASERADFLELVVQSDAQAEGAQLLEHWSIGVSRARGLLREWAGELEATMTDSGQLGAIFRLPYWQRHSGSGVAPMLAER
jgi:hypothetical protein